MTPLRSVAKTRGAWPERTVHRSSSKVTSRTQCSEFSMRQWSRTNLSNLEGLASSGDRLVRKYRVSVCAWPREVTRLVTFATWRSSGQSTTPTRAVVTQMFRSSCRLPCRDRDLVCWRGNSGAEK